MERVLTVAHVVRLMPHLFGGLCLHCGSVMHEILIDACTHLQQRFNNPANDKLSHASASLPPLVPHDFDVYASAGQGDEPPHFAITPLLLADRKDVEDRHLK